MKRLLGCILFSLVLSGMNVQADTGVAKLYLGGGFSDGTVDIESGGDKSLGTISGNVGVQILDFFGLEVAAGTGSDQASSILSEPLVTYQAVMMRLGFRYDRIGVYLLGGQARLDIDSAFNGSDSGNAYGFGLNLFGNDTTALNFNYLNFDDGAFKAATIGLQYYFGGFR